MSSSAVPKPSDKPAGDGSPWWAGELSPARRDELLDQCAEWVVRKRLEAPALMFLEMHKPLTTLASVGYTMGQPPLMLFFGFRRTEELRILLSDRANVEALMQRIERRSQEKTPSPPWGEGRRERSERGVRGRDPATPSSGAEAPPSPHGGEGISKAGEK